MLARSVAQGEKTKSVFLILLHTSECTVYTLGGWLCNRKPERQSVPACHMAWSSWRERYPKNLCSPIYGPGPQQAMPRRTILPFWQFYTGDDSTSSFLPLLPTGPQAGQQTLLLFLVVLLFRLLFLSCLCSCSFESGTQGLTAQTCWQWMH